jgi:hypothetical protein
MGQIGHLILTPSRCGTTAARLQANVATAVPAILTVTVGQIRYVVEASPAGALLDIPIDLRNAEALATLQTEAPRATLVGPPRFRREYSREIDNRAAVIAPHLLEVPGKSP